MTPSDVRAAAAELVQLHSRFAPVFGRKEVQAHSRVYLQGLLSAPGRKSAEPIALAFGQAGSDEPRHCRVIALQRFLSSAPWDHQAVQKEIQRTFAERLVPANTDWPIGTVGVIDASTFVKKGRESVGVKRQYCGRLGKVENCQAGVFDRVTPAGDTAGTQLSAARMGAGQPASGQSPRSPGGSLPDPAANRRRPAASLSRPVWPLRLDCGVKSSGVTASSSMSWRTWANVTSKCSDTTVWTEGKCRLTAAGRRPRRSRRSAVRAVRSVASAGRRALARLPNPRRHQVLWCLIRGAAGAWRAAPKGRPAAAGTASLLGPKGRDQARLGAADASLETLALVAAVRVEKCFGANQNCLGVASGACGAVGIPPELGGLGAPSRR